MLLILCHLSWKYRVSHKSKTRHTTKLFHISFFLRFGRNVFVGCVVTSASSGSDVMENILEELKM